jgi:hypothetical protein
MRNAEWIYFGGFMRRSRLLEIRRLQRVFEWEPSWPRSIPHSAFRIPHCLQLLQDLLELHGHGGVVVAVGGLDAELIRLPRLLLATELLQGVA